MGVNQLNMREISWKLGLNQMMLTRISDITWSVTDSHSFDDMFDYGICNVTYRLDKIERLLFELDYEAMIVTT